MNWVYNVAGRPVFVGPEGWLFYIGVLLCLVWLRKPQYALQLIVLVVMLIPSIVTEHPPSWTRSAGMLPALLATTALPIEWAWNRIEQWNQHGQGQLLIRKSYPVLIFLLGVSIYLRTATDMFQVWIDNPENYWMTLAFYDSTAKYINQSPDSTPVNYVMDLYAPWRKHNIQRPVQRRDVALRWSVHSALVFPDDPRGGRIAFQIFEAPAIPLLNAFLDLDAPIYMDPRVEPEGRRLLRVYFVPRARLYEHLVRAGIEQVFLPGTSVPLTARIRADDLLEFVGYEILDSSAAPGNDLNVLTYWRVLKRPPSIAIFLHLVDSEGHIVAQSDGFDAVVEALAVGDLTVQLHSLSTPDLPPKVFRFEMGAYRRDDLKRLPLSIGTDHVWLKTWQPTAR